QSSGAKRILEVRTLGGNKYSSIWMGKAIPDNGEPITLEVDQNAYKVQTAG
ncbi:hypothetical protein F5051DRAFT_334907, partial [Lentinula edodes]